MASKNARKKSKQTVALFVATFLITLVAVTFVIKSFSPNVDVEIGGESAYEDGNSDDYETSEDSKKAVDDRLKWIQLEDNMPGVSRRAERNTDEEITYESTSGKLKLAEPVKKRVDEEIKNNEGPAIELVNPNRVAPIPTVEKTVNPAVEPFKMAKVYVGQYSTIEQAIQAQNKLMNTSIGIAPFVKEQNGSYVLQAGSFASAQKAEAIAGQINAAGFSARVVQE